MVNRLPVLAVLLCLGAMLPGCTVCQLAKLVSLEEPGIYNTKKDQKISLVTYRALADEAWAETGAICPEDCTSADFSWGFREGFAEYVYAGGSGEAPALPPRSYWQSDMRTAEGARAVRSWFQGYRYGAQMAREGGYRQTATVTASASVRDCDACGRPGGCGEEGCNTCSLAEGGRRDVASPFEISGPTFQQPELQQPNRITPEGFVPAQESLPTPPTAPPLPLLEPSNKPSNKTVPNETVPDGPVPSGEELDLPLIFGTSAWKTSSPSFPASRPPSSLRGDSYERPSKRSPSVRSADFETRKVPSQKHSVSQAFFPLVR